MKIILLTLLLSSAVTANHCTPKKSNPKNEQCAKDLLKDGIGSLPADLQSQLMEPLVSKLAKKLMKDMMDDNDCQPEKPQQCSSTSDPGEIAKPSSVEGKKMFEKATNDLDENANQLKDEATGKIKEMGKDLTDKLAGDFKEHIDDALNAGGLQNLTKNVVDDAVNVIEKQIGWNIGKSMGEAGKAMEGLKHKVTEMPKAGLDFINKQLKGKTGAFLNTTLSALKGEMKGVMAGFIGAIGLDGLTNITGPGLEKKMKWLKSKLSAVVGDYSAQFGIGAKAVTGGVFEDFVATMPAEMRVNETTFFFDALLDMARPFVEMIKRSNEKLNRTIAEDAYHNMTHVRDLSGDEHETDVEVPEEVEDIPTVQIFHNDTERMYNTTTEVPITTEEATTTDEYTTVDSDHSTTEEQNTTEGSSEEATSTESITEAPTTTEEASTTQDAITTEEATTAEEATTTEGTRTHDARTTEEATTTSTMATTTEEASTTQDASPIFVPNIFPIYTEDDESFIN